MKTEYLSCADTAKHVRKVLKSNFPGVKFSVRSSTYSGGASISIGWIDGPTVKEVDRVTDRYSGADFDGMIDLKTYRDPTILAGENGELRKVSWGANYIFTNRALSEGFVRWWWENEAPRFTFYRPEAELTFREKYSPPFKGSPVWAGFGGGRTWIPDWSADLDTLLHRELYNLRVTPEGKVERVDEYGHKDPELVGSF